MSPTPLVRRGHGLGLALVGEHAESSDYDALARDVAAYDQRGCLSPRILFAKGELSSHAAQLHEALERVETHLPRGVVPSSIQASSAQWRSTAAALHTIFEGSSHALVVDEAANFPFGPTHRHLLLRPFDDFAPTLERLGSRAKVVGYATVNAPETGCRVCPLGEMQRPRLRDGADDYPPCIGFVRRFAE